MLIAYGREASLEETRRWYDGYRFGKAEVYNPWSILNYMDAIATNPEAFPAPYWANTSSTILRTTCGISCFSPVI